MQRTTRTTTSQSTAGGAGSPASLSGNISPVACRKCKSTQIVASKKGYSFSRMFKTLGWMALLPLLVVIIGVFAAQFLLMNMMSGGNGVGISEGLVAIIAIICWISISLSLPVGILVGFIGRNELVNGCMNCGFKWTPGKRK